MSDTIFEHYRSVLRDIDVFAETAHDGAQAPHYARYGVTPDAGEGWMDLYQIDHGIAIGRCTYSFREAYDTTYTDRTEWLSVRILLSGSMHLSTPGSGGHAYEGCMVALKHMHANEDHVVRYRYPPNETFQGISIDVPAPLVDELFGGRPLAGHSGLLRPSPDRCYAVLDRRHACQRHGIRTALALLGTSPESAVGRLQIEGAALQFVAALAGPCCLGAHSRTRVPRPRHRVAVDDAIDILRHEFAQSHTIASLARRVGLNECYLKTAFRQVTGQTIGDFLRHTRMGRARELIENGRMTVLQACQFVGYSNPAQFAAAFRRIHGIAPSSLK
ncbi:helix-turn-helix transcriptional regulator [Pseudothauera rhizosphaerae]|nr:AraC family transcriptional regulator [Pseudothauera rhizosphaerae]